MDFEVTKADIVEGIQQNCSQCPTAHAIRRKTKAEKILVQRNVITIDGKRYRTPDSVNSFEALSDAGRTVAPYKFSLTDADLVR